MKSFEYWRVIKCINRLVDGDDDVHYCITTLPNNYVIRVGVFYSERFLCLQVVDGKLRWYKPSNAPSKVDLCVLLKSMVFFNQLIRGDITTVDLFNKNQVSIRGSIEHAGKLSFAFKRAMGYLTPRKKYVKVYGYEPVQKMDRRALIKSLYRR